MSRCSPWIAYCHVSSASNCQRRNRSQRYCCSHLEAQHTVAQLEVAVELVAATNLLARQIGTSERLTHLLIPLVLQILVRLLVFLGGLLLFSLLLRTRG